MIRIAITKGRIEKDTCKLLKACGFDVEPIENKGRELLIKTKDDIEMIFAKANDVLTFIEHGIVDLGIVGKDTLDESDFTDYNELLDLNVGKCYFALAAYPEYREKTFKERKKIATKYPNVAKKYFGEQQENVEIIKIEGSVELGAVIGMTDAIVDLVETGSTLKANGLEVIEKITDISTRLIANKVSLKYKGEEIYNIVDKFYEKIKGEN